ncbi:response regulator [Legionella israelensis]|nr:response regulator [Legionella israelensis]
MKGVVMHLLIVEDNSFNANCLQRLLETVSNDLKINLVNNSTEASSMIKSNPPDCIILDGDLGVTDGLNCHGPALAEAIWQHYPHMHIIAWTDSEAMRQAFKAVYNLHGKSFNEYCCWPKIVSQERLHKSMAYFNQQFHSVRKNPVAEDVYYLNTIG